MKASATKQRRRVGTVVQIPLDASHHTYARVLAEPLIAFYDARTSDDMPLDQIVKRPTLFKLWVMNQAVTSGRWKIVGISPLEESLMTSPAFFKQDVVDPRFLSIYQGSVERPASREECEGLERAAVWDPSHVEDRLRDHYAGRPNQWYDSLRIKWTDLR